MIIDPISKLESSGAELKRLVEALRQAGEQQPANQILSLYEKLRPRAVRAVVVGAFNQGKSTLINAMLGAKVLPVALVPTTAVMTRVVSALPPGATLHYADGRPDREVSLEEVSEHLTLDPDGKPRPPLRLVEIRCPWRSLDDFGLELYDTPGFNDLPEQAETAREAIENADILLFMLNARQPLTEQEELIWQGWAAEVGAKPIFLLNFLNLLDEDDRELALERVRTGLRERLNLLDNPELREINALLALRARMRRDEEVLAESRLPELVERLEYFAGEGRAALLTATRLGRLQRLLGEIYTSNTAKLSEAEEKLRGWQARQARQEAARKQAERAASSFAGLEAWKRQALKDFEYKLMVELEQAVERWPLEHLRQQIEGMVGQRMRDWLVYFEQEINRQLAALAPSNNFKPHKFNVPSIPAFNYTYTPPAPQALPDMPNPLEKPFDFLGTAVRGLGQIANEMTGQYLSNEPNRQAEQQARVVAHARLAPFVREVVTRLDKPVSEGLAAARPNFVPKAVPVEPTPPGLEAEVAIRHRIEESLKALAAIAQPGYQ